MSLTSTDFRGITVIDHELIEQLTAFLGERERELTDAIYQSLGLDVPSEDLDAPLAERLQEVTDAVASTSSLDAYRTLQHTWNEALWRYLEILEGGVSQLFQQLDQVGIDEWTYELSQVVDGLEVLFREKMSSHTDAVILLENSLWRCSSKARGATLGWLPQSLQRVGSFLLDRQLLPNLRKSQRFLQTRYGGWQSRYAEYVKLGAQAEQSLKKFESFALLRNLSPESQEQFLLIYRILKIWEVDAKEKAILLQDLTRALKPRVASEEALGMYRAYYSLLHDSLFDASRALKLVSGGSQSHFESAKSEIHGELVGTRKELTTLGSALARYREFLLRTDPNPYVRSRWGFAEWVVGPEPTICRSLLRLELSVEGLAVQYQSFLEAVAKADISSGFQPLDKTPAHSEIEGILRMMGQPLNSRHVMASHVDRLVEALRRFDELNAMYPETIPFITNVLSRALKTDKKYHLLHDNAQFSQLFCVHRDLINPMLRQEDHDAVVARLRTQIAKILGWLVKGHLEKHMADVDIFAEEVTHTFQGILDRCEDTLPTLAIESEREAFVETQRSRLLELRYILGTYYRRLLKYPADGRQVRGQFVAADQILDAVEAALVSVK